LGEKSPIGQKIAQNMQPNPFIPGFYSRKIWRKIAHSPMFANKHRGTAHRTDYQMLQNEPFVQNTFSALKNVHNSKVCQEADIFLRNTCVARASQRTSDEQTRNTKIEIGKKR
jgi:hypothetical protein